MKKPPGNVTETTTRTPKGVLSNLECYWKEPEMEYSHEFTDQTEQTKPPLTLLD